MFLGVKTKTDTLGFHMGSSVSTIIQCSKRVKHVFGLICNVLCFFLQPAKLTEAFKYFIQGMGYSKFTLSSSYLPYFYRDMALVLFPICFIFLFRYSV